MKLNFLNVVFPIILTIVYQDILASPNIFSKKPPSNEDSPLRLMIIYATDSVTGPVARIGPYTETILTVTQILKNPFLQVHAPGEKGKHVYTIHHFKIVVEYQTGELHESETNANNRLSIQQLAIIKALQPGDRIHFEWIKGKIDHGPTKMYPNFSITIK